MSEQRARARVLYNVLNFELRLATILRQDYFDCEAALVLHRESLDLRRRLRESVGDTARAWRDLSVSLNRVGDIERDLGNLEAARTLYREGRDLCRQLSGAFPDNLRHRRDLAWIETQIQALGEPS